MTYEVNPTLIDLAAWRLRHEAEKQAFVPAGGDPAAGGAPPPPGGAPPMDPAAGGAPPPMDPAAGGGAPPMDPMAAGGGAPPADPALAALITQIVQQVMQQQGGGTGTPGPAGPGKGSAKIDPGLVYMELGRVRKLLTGMYQNLDWELPPDILDDSAVAQSVAGGAPPAGQPLPAGGASPAGGAPPADPAAAGLPGIGQSSPINPIQPAGPEAKAAAALRSTAGDDVLRILGLAGESGGSQISPRTFEDANLRTEAVAQLARSVNGAA